MARALALPLALAAVARAGNFLTVGRASGGDATRFLEQEIADRSSGGHVARVADELRATYGALPKNAYGHLGHDAVRYVLHRHFVQRAGWFIRGLEPSNDTWAEDGAAGRVKEWVPAHLQHILEERVGARGASLRDLAALAAALEDLVDQEARGRLEMILEAFGLPRGGEISASAAREVLTTYYIIFLSASNYPVAGRDETLARNAKFAERYDGWHEAQQWLNDTLAPHLDEGAQATLGFEALTSLAERVGEGYYRFNDLECRDLKATLRGLEAGTAGRVRLSSFYQKALVSHWRLTERPEYLRALGALDETDPKSPQVILSNYVMARPNCLESSSLYAVCCRNECEDLMGSLEARIGAPAAAPERVAELVAALPSDSVPAPRVVPSGLRARLAEIAEAHGGQVPLHGRLFAQWMHHAYPRECPYPHEAGASNPQTPDEWMAHTGQEASQATEAEMAAIVAADTCASADGSLSRPGECEGSELPWTAREELLEAPPPKEAAPPPLLAPTFAWDVSAAGVLALGLAADAWRHRVGAPRGSAPHIALEKPVPNDWPVDWRAAVAIVIAAFLAHALNLLDTMAFMCTLVAGSALAIAQHLEKRRADAIAAREALAAKCCV